MSCLTKEDCPDGHECESYGDSEEAKTKKKHCAKAFNSSVIAVIIIYICVFVTCVSICVWVMRTMAFKRKKKQIKEQQKIQKMEEIEMQKEIIRNQK